MEAISYRVNVSDQVNDGILTAEEMVDFLRSKMKVNNSRKLAEKELRISSSSKEVTIDGKGVTKRNMKHYVKRFLKFKSLLKFVKVLGDENNVNQISLQYINAVDNEE